MDVDILLNHMSDGRVAVHGRSDAGLGWLVENVEPSYAYDGAYLHLPGARAACLAEQAEKEGLRVVWVKVIHP